MTTLETERLLLRPFVMDDLDAAFAIFENHPDVWRYDPGRPRTLEERREILQYRMLDYQQHKFGCLAVVLRSSGALIGYCGLQFYLFEGRPFSTPEIELFYKFGRDYWGQGYASEACRAVIDHAFGKLHLKRLVTWTHRENAHSIRLLQRLGMTIEPAPNEPEFVIAVLENKRSGERHNGA